MAQNPDLQRFPPGFNHTLPDMESNPDWFFYTSLRNFFNKNKKWDFCHQRSVKQFNDLLTKAIHKDAERTRDKFNAFRARLQKVELIFESLKPVYTYIVKYNQYVENCLEKRFEWQEFPNYVKKVNGWVKGYVKLMCRYQYYQTPLNWPKSTHHKEVLTKPNKSMVQIAISNFQQANAVYDKLFEQWLQPDYVQIISWMNKSNCLLPFRKEFEETQHWIFTFSMKTKKTNMENIYALGSTMDLCSCQETKHNFSDVVQESIESLKTAFESYLPMMERQHKEMRNVVLKVYDHTLKVLESFHELANSQQEVPIDVDEHANQERLNAMVAAKRWTAALRKESNSISTSKILTHYLQDLPLLYKYMARFSFINCGDVRELEGFPPD